MVNWVTGTPSLEASGTYSLAASRVMTTPAAWVEAWRGMPSILMAVSMSSFTCGSASYWAFSSGETSSARFRVIFSSMGTILEMESTWA